MRRTTAAAVSSVGRRHRLQESATALLASILPQTAPRAILVSFTVTLDRLALSTYFRLTHNWYKIIDFNSHAHRPVFVVSLCNKRGRHLWDSTRVVCNIVDCFIQLCFNSCQTYDVMRCLELFFIYQQHSKSCECILSSLGKGFGLIPRTSYTMETYLLVTKHLQKFHHTSKWHAKKIISRLIPPHGIC